MAAHFAYASGSDNPPHFLRHVEADHGRARPAKKKSWGALTDRWVPHDTRNSIVDFVRTWSDKMDLPACRFLPWIGLGTSKFHDWKQRFGKVNEHNAWVPRDHWLTDDEKERICVYVRQHPLEGYRRLQRFTAVH